MSSSTQDGAVRAEVEPDEAARLTRRLARERSARAQAEALLEAKSLELFEANEALKAANQMLEATVAERTSALRAALEAAQSDRLKFEISALHDPLTELPNRRYLRQKLDELAAQCHADETESLAILHVDLDRFKQINDTLGHAAGDFLLKEVAERLRGLLRSGAFAARIGGDEFVIAAPFSGPCAPIYALAESIVARMAEPAEFEGATLRFGASVGVAQATGLQVEAGALLVNADIALYRAKDQGRGGVAIFSTALQKEMRRRKRVADELCEGLERGEFVPYYQPRVLADGGAIDCVEVLARWRHPTRGLLAPADFLPIADDLGLTADLDDVILCRALADFRGWRAEGLAIPRISVNVSHGRLTDPALFDKLARSGVAAGEVSFELLESVFLDNAEASLMARLERLKRMGVAIEIDDFGSGHASIVGVLNVRPSVIKIDRRLVSAVSDVDGPAPLVRAIVDIGASLGAQVVAEGVETPDCAACCAALGCAALQGYAFAKPMAAADMAAFARRDQLIFRI